MRIVVAILFALLFAAVGAAQTQTQPQTQTQTQLQTQTSTSQVLFVTSKDGTRIAVECAGAGPNLLIVHGGTGDRKRWRPLLPMFARNFNVCAMDRRGHGESQPGPKYTFRKESEDIVAVVNSRSGPVFVLGHSIGGVFSLEAALLTKKIAGLALYEPPLQDLDHTEVANRMERLIQAGDREQALLMFFREIVKMSPEEIETVRSRPVWPERVAGIDIQIREIRALSKYRFDPNRMRRVRVPTLLLAGSETRSPQLKQAITSLVNTLSNRTLVILEGEEHNAMDTIPQQFADHVTKFLLKR